MYIVNGNVFCADGVFRAMELEVGGECITAIGERLVRSGADVLDAGGCYVVPGLVDIHIHGALGADFCDGSGAAIETMARFLLSRGVTSFLGTSMTLPAQRLSEIYRTVRPYVGASIRGGATLRGINMEGPFLSAEKCGAQAPAHIIPPDYELFCTLNETCGGSIRTVAVAPEGENALDFIERAGAVCHVSLAHSCAGYDLARQAFERGADHVTHVFNAMPPFHHRDPGIVGAAAESGAYVELICDGVHAHPAAVRAAFRLFGDERVCLISDAMRACGMPEREYELGGQAVRVANGCATIASGALAGSVTVLTDCLRKAVRFGIPLESALKDVTINPACSVGLEEEIGSLTCGKAADILLLDRDLELRAVLHDGRLWRL